jgi:hypothetical protein
MDQSRTLFALQTPCRWFPDETLYSLCSRHHRVAGNVGAARTCLELFGPSHSSGSRLGGLEALSRRTGGQLGSAESIVQERTMHPFFRAFMPANSASRMLDAMLSGTPGGLRHALDCDLDGLLPRHALRACLQCAREDLETRNIAYWHRNHQWPGVYRCHRHGLALFEVVQRPMHEQGFAWLLPSIDGMEDALEEASAPAQAHAPAAGSASRLALDRRSAASSNADSLRAPHSMQVPVPAAQAASATQIRQTRSNPRLAYFIPAPLAPESDEIAICRHAAMAQAIGQHRHCLSLDLSVLAQLYRMLFSRRGLISALNGLPRVPEAGEELRASATPVLHLREFSARLRTGEQASEHARRLVTSRRMPRDPVLHLIAMTWLARDWEAFLRQYEAIARLTGGKRPADFWNQPLSI